MMDFFLKLAFANFLPLFKKSLDCPFYVLALFSFPIFLALRFKIINLLKENLDRPFHIILWFSPKDLRQRILFLTSSILAEVSHTHSANQSSWCEMPLPSSKLTILLSYSTSLSRQLMTKKRGFLKGDEIPKSRLTLSTRWCWKCNMTD